jgi:hypothetical protein
MMEKAWRRRSKQGEEGDEATSRERKARKEQVVNDSRTTSKKEILIQI